MVNRHFILFALAFAAALSGVAKTFDVDISSGRPAASNEAYYHGETIEFRAVRGRTVVTNIEYGCIYYQTNGMDQAWWKTDGLVFHPTNDVGAAGYRFFLEGRDEVGRDWHANGLLRLLDSPGFVPNAIEPPVTALDFSAIEVSNAPWLLPDATNATLAAAKDYADDAIAAIPPPPPADFTANNETLVATILEVSPPPPPADFTANNETLVQTIEAVAPAAGNYAAVSNAAMSAANYADDTSAQALASASQNATNYTNWVIEHYDPPTVDLSPDNEELVETIQAVAPEPDLSGYSTTGDLAALAAEVAPAVAAYPRVYSFMTGATNANFVVTNYQLTAEADAGRTHFNPADPDLDFSTVPSSLRLEDFSSGTNRVVCDTRDWTVWYFACKIGGAINTAFTNAVATCRAWCGFTATGLENPVPDTLIVDVPNIWLMAGKTFEKHVAGTNSMWVIRSKDTVVPISDNSQSAGGFLELTDAFGEPYIRFNKSESYFIDPSADGIEYDAATGAWCVSYPTQNKPKGGANAVLEGSATYPGKAVLKDEDDPDCPATITWTGSAGAWVMNAVPKAVGGVVPSQMFFGAVIEVEGQDYIEYLRPMSTPHLLVDGVKIAPVVPATHPAGTTVTWKVVE